MMDVEDWETAMVMLGAEGSRTGRKKREGMGKAFTSRKYKGKVLPSFNCFYTCFTVIVCYVSSFNCLGEISVVSLALTQVIYVAVPCRNRRLFCRVFRSHRYLQSAVSLNFR